MKIFKKLFLIVTGLLLTLGTASAVFTSCLIETDTDTDAPAPVPTPTPGTDEVAITGIYLNKTTLELVRGDSETLVAEVSPADADEPVTWVSSNESIVEVDVNGKVTAVAKGEAIITARSRRASSTCKVKVTQPAVSISLNKTTLELLVGGSERLVATLLPDNADNVIAWSSSDSTKATVDANGTVTAVAAGEATIIAKASDKTVTCKVAIVWLQMVIVEGGPFTMGATAEQGSGYSEHELPTHSVTLSGFQMGKYEVTQATWKTIMGSNPSYSKGDDLPVENVSWDDCQTFIEKLKSITGKNYRLPTEAEWEYAARGGAQSQGYRYSGSNTLGDVTWDVWYSLHTRPVGTKLPNELSIYDMSGNVWEWCNDWYGDYEDGEQTSPTGALAGSFHVLRGGSWNSGATNCRVSNRGSGAPDFRGYDIGFRLVLPEPGIPTLWVDKTAISAIATAERYSIGLTSNSAWMVSSDAEWCTISPSSGAGDGKITVDVAMNTTMDSRSATVTVTAGTATQTVIVTQAAANSILILDKASIAAIVDEETYSIGVTAYSEWTVSSDAEWCTISPLSGTGSGTITVNVAENTFAAIRSATVTVTTGVVTKTVIVTQAAANAILILDKTEISTNATAASYFIGVTSNSAWTVRSDAGWCTFSSPSGTGDGTITVNVAENTMCFRSATVTVTAWAITKTVIVTQEASVPPSNFTETGGGLNFNMIGVAGCTFTMGATDEQGSDAESNELPTHSVTLGNYAIGKYEVTQRLWEDVMGSNPSHFKGNNLPVEMVSYDDIQSFLTALNTKTGKNYRLPTEAEWEYAARGGNRSAGYKYSGSNTVGDVAWYGDGSTTHAVGTKAPNELGICDMSGNVWEWCSDWYGDYHSGEQTNPTGATTGSDRVVRGGRWGNNAEHCRVSRRNNNAPNGVGSDLGFRLVLPL
ncbi:hypothetical protein AGMMS4957_14310 [Bacteroidia bacterium]|nr:hypothetical protein AGMMS4957_14310 [Bacteroidia bacterium]